jgi:hypothetical protein
LQHFSSLYYELFKRFLGVKEEFFNLLSPSFQPDMGRLKGRRANLKKARDKKLMMRKLRSTGKGGSRAGAFAGASDAFFLQPLPSDAPSGRLSPPPKYFDPSFVAEQRKRRASLSPPPEPSPKSDLPPCPLSSSSPVGLIWKS